MSRNQIPKFEDWVKDVPEVEDLYGKVRGLRSSEVKYVGIPEFLGQGRDKIVFGVGDYALKLHRRRHETPFPQTVGPLRRAMGIKGVEQVVAVSHEKQIIVSNRIVGMMPAKLRAESLAQRYINPGSIDRLNATLDAMRDSGLYVEGPKNLLVNSDGFHVIDPADHFMHDMSVNSIDGALWLISGVGWSDDFDGIAYRTDNEQRTIRDTFLSSMPRY
jgi:hypothetical protein